MIRDQCKAYCQCSYCKQTGEQMRGIPDSIKLTSGKGRSRDEMYLRTLNQTLRARSLMASSKNACKFQPDEILQSTRGDMARAALTVPVRRRDRLQELLILENKERIKAERQRRQNLRAMGLPDDAEKTSRDFAVGTRDDFNVERELGKTNDAEVVLPRAHSADEDLRHVLNTVRAITEEHDAGDSSKSLTSDQIHRLRRLVQEHDNKRKKATADSPLQPHVADHCHQVSQPNTQQKLFPSIHDRSTRRLKYNSHPYGTGVVWLPLEEENTDENGKNATFTAAGKLDNTKLSDEAYAEHQYPGGTYNKYLNDGPKAAEGTTLNDAFPPTADNLAASADPKSLEKGNNAENLARSDAERKSSLKEKPTYKSSAALWRTTNQDCAAQMKRFLEFKKLQTDAARVYAESAVRRPAQVGTADTVAAGDRNTF
ncbi:hypothetical protein MOQ_004808 [Trypanosoma cruzi marinkellei]|uniref:Uncharacterized protein n=1 Tax=Trypanosoma cruzi marinkellei TaxID=85056 RepID=K2MZZ1_TRYCR|nr:hypothetical protein MOQ_004808 [Trypanosoma cruzi marinkellei]